MRPIAQADRGRSARNFFLRNHMLDIAKAETAPLLLDRDPVQPKFAHLRPKLDRKAVLSVDFGCQRRDSVGREALSGLADGIGHLAEVEV